MNTEKLVVPDSKPFPEDFCLWKTTGNIALINETDFEIKPFLETLGVTNLGEMQDSFSIADENEISARQAINSDLLNNSALLKWSTSDVWLSALLPNNVSDFVHRYQTNRATDRFWGPVKECLKVLEKSNLSSNRLITLRNLLRENMLFEQIERDAAMHIQKHVENMVVATGTMQMSVDFSHGGTAVYCGSFRQDITGFRRYGSKLLRAEAIAPPDWLQDTGGHIDWLKKLPRGAIKMYRLLYLMVARKWESIQGNLTTCLVQHVEDSARMKIREMFNGLPSTKRLLLRNHSYNITVTVVHDSDGTRFRIGSIERTDKPTTDHRERFLQTNDSSVWPMFARMAMNKEMDRQRKWLINVQAIATSAKLIDALQRVDKELFEWIPVSGDWLTKEYYVWPSMADLWNDPAISDAVHAMQKFMNDAYECIIQLRAMASIVAQLQRKAEQWNAPLTIPKQVPGGHIVAFDRLFPVHVYGHPNVDTVVPFANLEPLGGKTIGITGQYGSGKTALSQALAHLIYLAQTGFPVFGDGVRWNVRSAIGLSLLGREAGKSTMQLSGQKVANMLHAVREIPRERLLLIMDELGTGAEDENGAYLGGKVLGALRGVGVDLLFTTQVSRFASEAQAAGATCYFIGRNHLISNGVDKADIRGLMDETGLTDAIASLEALAQA